MPAKKRVASPFKGSPRAKAVKTVDHDFLGLVAPVLELLEESQTDAACIKMLQAVAPDCLRTLKAERHPHQMKIAAMLECEVAAIEAKHSHAVAEAKENVADHNAAEGDRAAAVARSEEALSSKREDLELKKTALAEASSAVKNTKSAFAHEKEEQSDLDRSHHARIAEKEEVSQVFQDEWNPLKAGEQKDWRKRNKSIDVVSSCLTSVGADLALADAVTPALKAKVHERGPFSEKVIVHAEAAFTKHLAQLDARIVNIDAEREERATAVQRAEASFENARSQEAACKEALATCESEVAEEEQTLKKAMKAVDQAVPKSKRLAKALETEESRLDRVHVVVDQFRHLNERCADVPEEAPEASIAEDREEAL